MGVQNAIIVAALGGLAYIYLSEEEKSAYTDISNNTTCGPIMKLIDISGQKFCKPKLECKPGFVLSQDMTQCFDEKQPCGPGFDLITNPDDTKECKINDSACGDRCYKLNEAQDNCIKIAGCGTATGSETGDIFLYIGESIFLGVIYDFLGRKVMNVADRVIAREATKKAAVEAAKQAASKATTQVAKGAATKGATKLATSVATKQLAARAGQVAAKRTGLQIAIKLAKKLATKIAISLAKMAAMTSTGIGILATPLMALSMSLSIGMAASGTYFEVPPGQQGKVFDWNELPELATTALTSIPVLG